MTYAERKLAEIREYYTVDYPDSNPKDDALFLIAHIDKLEARVAEQADEIKDLESTANELSHRLEEVS